MAEKSFPWDKIVPRLDKWREELALKDPSVSTVAEAYRRSPWAVLLSTIVSLRTKDEVTVAASERLLAKAPSPETFLKLSVREAEKLMYPAGFYHTKVQNLQKISRILIKDYGGNVPADMEKLLALPGVGRKTANLVLTEAFDMDGVCVDTHVHRICNRLGAVQTKKPDDTEMRLREILPRKYWKHLNALLVLYGQRQCKPIGPLCSSCPIVGYCARTGVEKSR
jgi:endonuclease-3